MSPSKKTNKKLVRLIAKTLLTVLLISLNSLSFCQQKQVLIARVDSLIISLNETNNIEEAILKESEIYNLAKSISYEKGVASSRIILISKLINHDLYDKTIKLIDETTAEGINFSPAYKIQLLLIKARSYQAIGLYPENQETLELAKSEAMKLQKNYNYHLLMGQILVAIGYTLETNHGPQDSVIINYQDSYKHYSKIKYTVGMIHAASQLGYFYFEKKQYDSAKKFLLAVPKIKEIDKKNSPEIRLVSYLNPAILDFVDKQYGESIMKYQTALNVIDSFNLSPQYKKQIYNCLIEAYNKNNDKKMEKVYLNKYAEISDSLTLSEKKLMRQPLENIIKEKTHSANKNRTFYAMLLVSVTGLLIFGFFRINKTNRGGIFVIENFPTASQPLLAPAKPPENEGTDEDLKTIIELAKRNDLELFTKFNAFDPMFIQKLELITTDLSASELGMCVYLRLNFETKEIARFANLSVRAVQGRKYRIRRKLKISSEEDLNIWMTNL